MLQDSLRALALQLPLKVGFSSALERQGMESAADIAIEAMVRRSASIGPHPSRRVLAQETEHTLRAECLVAKSVKMTLSLSVVGDIPNAIIERARAFVAPHRTLEDATRSASTLSPARFVRAVVIQDEYTHDVVFPFEGETYLVYDAT